MNYSVKLKLNLNPFKEGIDVTSYNKHPHVQIPIGDLNFKLYNFFSARGLKISLAEMFYTAPNETTVIHTDAKGGDYTKLNWIFGGTNSYMCWYNVKDGINKSPAQTSISTGYVGYEPNEVDLIAKSNVGFPSIVQVGVPHNIENTNEDRFCLSIVFVDTLKYQRPTMDQSLKLFSDLVDRDGFEPS